MDNYSDSVMIALLPTNSDWSKIECPNLTLVYAGETKDLDITAFNELGKDASMLSMLSKPIILKVVGVEVFGDVDKVDVLRFRPTPELWSMRRAVERWNASEHPFKLHATIGPVGMSSMDYPAYITFDRIMVGWGDEKLTFSMQSSPSVYQKER